MLSWRRLGHLDVIVSAHEIGIRNSSCSQTVQLPWVNMLVVPTSFNIFSVTASRMRVSTYLNTPTGLQLSTSAVHSWGWHTVSSLGISCSNIVKLTSRGITLRFHHQGFGSRHGKDFCFAKIQISRFFHRKRFTVILERIDRQTDRQPCPITCDSDVC